MRGTDRVDQAHLGLQHCVVVRNAEDEYGGERELRTCGGWDPYWSDQEAGWDQASEEREVGMVVMKA